MTLSSNFTSFVNIGARPNCEIVSKPSRFSEFPVKGSFFMSMMMSLVEELTLQLHSEATPLSRSGIVNLSHSDSDETYSSLRFDSEEEISMEER